MQPIKRYLMDTQARLASADRLHVVLGNPAADLDSMVSALVYAFFLADGAASRKPLSCPLINIPRNDFKLRPEAVFLFQDVGIRGANLIFVDDIRLRRLHAARRIALTLIDHHELAPFQSYLKDAVVEILDHHVDSGSFAQLPKRCIERVGSTATLVAEHVLAEKAHLVDGVVAKLLLGAIILDTVNLTPGVGRTSVKDRDIAARLLRIRPLDCDALFQALTLKKADISGLSTPDLLRKDFKSWQIGPWRCGVSSVPLKSADWMARDENFVQELAAHAEKQRLDMMWVMTYFFAPQFGRELIGFAQDPSLLEQVIAELKKGTLELQSIRPREAVDDRVFLFKQLDSSMSRKKFKPLLDRALNQVMVDA